MYQFDAGEGNGRVPELLEPEHDIHPRFDVAVVLLDQVVQVLRGPLSGTCRKARSRPAAQVHQIESGDLPSDSTVDEAGRIASPNAGLALTNVSAELSGWASAINCLKDVTVRASVPRCSWVSCGVAGMNPSMSVASGARW
jgi:hypothetical protein